MPRLPQPLPRGGSHFGEAIGELLGIAAHWRTRRRAHRLLRRNPIGVAVLASVVLVVLPTAIGIVATPSAIM